jgi:glutamate dehydrogenase (NADP+)
MSYLSQVYDGLIAKNPGEEEFHQAVREVFDSLEIALPQHPEFEQTSMLERFTEPERVVMFRVPWVNDNGEVQVNKGFRVEFNSAIGPYKGGLRLHPSVKLGTLKFLGFEQILKNALTGIPMGGGKGGSDFDPKGKSDNEVMRFCQSFMTELFRHIGAYTDVPAGDIGVGGREIGFMFGQYKRLENKWEGVLTGKGLNWGGSFARTPATGYGLVYITHEYLKDVRKTDFNGKTVTMSGSGNVAIYACEKVHQLGGKVVTMSDSNGCIIDMNGIDLDLVKDIKEVRRGRIKEYLQKHPEAKYSENRNDVWKVKCDVALPNATQNELDLEDAKALVANGCLVVGEGANMPTTLEGTKYLLENGVGFLPGKAANAGGVAVSGLEMAQNSYFTQWTFEEVDGKLKGIMQNIWQNISTTAKKYGVEGNYVHGANIAGFMKVANSMMDQGVV